eukprot:3677535-Rhodomonas_salina.4
MSGTAILYGGCGIVLRVCYAMSGTAKRMHYAISCYVMSGTVLSVLRFITTRTDLRGWWYQGEGSTGNGSVNSSGTIPAYCAMCVCYAMSGTGVAYGATQSLAPPPPTSPHPPSVSAARGQVSSRPN